MSDKDFKRFADFIIHHRNAASSCPRPRRPCSKPGCRSVCARSGHDDYRSYCEYLFTPEGLECELCNLIDQVTTNTTDFFREPKHFEYMYSTLLPQWMASGGDQRPLRIWSAGCSIGAEALYHGLRALGFRRAGFTFPLQHPGHGHLLRGPAQGGQGHLHPGAGPGRARGDPAQVLLAQQGTVRASSCAWRPRCGGWWNSVN